VRRQTLWQTNIEARDHVGRRTYQRRRRSRFRRPAQPGSETAKFLYRPSPGFSRAAPKVVVRGQRHTDRGRWVGPRDGISTMRMGRRSASAMCRSPCDTTSRTRIRTAAHLEMFRSDRCANLSLNQWLALTPHVLVDAHLKIDREVVSGLSTAKVPVLPK
jgi:hypothetical protein